MQKHLSEPSFRKLLDDAMVAVAKIAPDRIVDTSSNHKSIGTNSPIITKNNDNSEKPVVKPLACMPAPEITNNDSEQPPEKSCPCLPAPEILNADFIPLSVSPLAQPYESRKSIKGFQERSVKRLLQGKMSWIAKKRYKFNQNLNEGMQKSFEEPQISPPKQENIVTEEVVQESVVEQVVEENTEEDVVVVEEPQIETIDLDETITEDENVNTDKVVNEEEQKINKQKECPYIVESEPDTILSRNKAVLICVVNKNYPYKQLNNNDLNLIKSLILEAIWKGEYEHPPLFYEATIQRSYLLLSCKSEMTVKWVELVIPKLETEELHIRTVPYGEMWNELRLRANFDQHCPPAENSDYFLNGINLQNPDLNAWNWKVLEFNKSTLVFRVDNYTFAKLKNNLMTINFGLGQLKIQIEPSLENPTLQRYPKRRLRGKRQKLQNSQPNPYALSSQFPKSEPLQRLIRDL